MNFLSNKLSGEIPKFPPKIPPQKYSITTRANIILFFRLTATCHPQTYKLQFFLCAIFPLQTILKANKQIRCCSQTV